MGTSTARSRISTRSIAELKNQIGVRRDKLDTYVTAAEALMAMHETFDFQLAKKG